MSARKKAIVFILSSSYSGSHFLSLQLGSNSRTKHMGEVRKLISQRVQQSRELTLNKGDILEGIGPDNIDQVYDLIFSRIDPKIDAIIDASKKVERWAARWLNLDKYDRKYIHLIRDPRAMVRRWKLRTTTNKNLRFWGKLCRFNSAWIPHLMLPDETKILTYRWLMENMEITRFLQENRLDSHVVTYRDLAVEPEATLQRVMAWMNIPYEPSQLEYWKFDHIGTQKKAYKEVNSRDECRIDLRWQKELPLADQEQILKTQAVQEYIKSIGLSVKPDGLSADLSRLHPMPAKAVNLGS